MAKLSEVAPAFETHPLIAEKDTLMGVPLLILNARGPFKSKKIAGSQFVILTIMRADGQEFDPLTPEQAEAFPDGDDLRDILMSAIPQRVMLADYFATEEGKQDTVGPVTLEKLDVGQPSPMWNLVDVDEQPQPAENGKRKRK
jgi:hypothetical protein